MLQFKLTKKYGNIRVVSSYWLKGVCVRAAFWGQKILAGVRNSLCANDAVFAQSLLSKARNHNCRWPETYVFIYRVFPVHLVLFGSGCVLPTSSLLARFAAVVGECREVGSEVIQVAKRIVPVLSQALKRHQLNLPRQIAKINIDLFYNYIDVYFRGRRLCHGLGNRRRFHRHPLGHSLLRAEFGAMFFSSAAFSEEGSSGHFLSARKRAMARSDSRYRAVMF